jgi:hypothetical protein
VAEEVLVDQAVDAAVAVAAIEAILDLIVL